VSAIAPLQPLQRVGDYELVRLLGAGGMGDVWLATDTRAERPVALKFIKPHLLADQGFRTRFLNEAKTLGRLEHDRIVTLYNVVESDGHLALVLRFIDGVSLADRIDADGALPLDTVLACARDVLEALGFAHEHGTIHRDIKSQNVLIDRRGRAFLTDFGIAVGSLVQRNTMTGFAIGTPHYMSPEQIQTPSALTAQKGGHRSDIYSFGIVLFEMLTGRVPFGGDSNPDETFLVQHAHCTTPPPALRSINADVPPAIEAVVLRCLAKSPDDRPQSCAALLQELEIAARPGPVADRAHRAATVFEGGRPSVPAPPAPAPPAPAPPPLRPARGLSAKAAWLALGAVVMVGGVGLAIWNQAEPPATEATQPSSSSTTAVTPQPGRSGSSPPPIREPQTPPREAVSQPVSPSVQPAPLVDRAADQSFRRAQTLARNGQWCEAQSAINDAVKRSPTNPNYLELKEEIDVGCNAANQPQ
jgi:serine/threonine protein kinase